MLDYSCKISALCDKKKLRSLESKPQKNLSHRSTTKFKIKIQIKFSLFLLFFELRNSTLFSLDLDSIFLQYIYSPLQKVEMYLMLDDRSSFKIFIIILSSSFCSKISKAVGSTETIIIYWSTLIIHQLKKSAIFIPIPSIVILLCFFWGGRGRVAKPQKF